jgi:LPPG:FO 2-phospho-L-lactate transferase
MHVVLAGGVGGARFAQGLAAVVPPEAVTVVVNTGDDYDFQGLRVCPDLDINVYTLAGVVDPERGWGLAGDTFSCLEVLRRYGAPQTWFQVGDRDLATHLERTRALAGGETLSQVTARLARAWGVRARILPMSDQDLRTHVLTPAGELHFQEYLVQRRAQDEFRGIRLVGVERARPAPGVLEAIAAARVIIVPPSNPLVSVGPILAVPGIRGAIRDSGAPVVGVSPIVGGRTIKGPADRMLAALGHAVSPLGVAEAYGDLLGGMVIDRADAQLEPALRARGLAVAVTDTLMTSPERKAALARAVLALAEGLRRG